MSQTSLSQSQTNPLAPAESCVLFNHISIVITPADDLLNGRPQQESMLELSSVAPLDIDKRRIRFDNARRNEIIQPEQVFLLTETVEVPATERQSAEILVNDVE